MRIADVLRGKGTTVATVGPTATVAELVATLSSYNVGAMPVLDGARLNLHPDKINTLVDLKKP